jgi:hypothetical protein
MYAARLVSCSIFLIVDIENTAVVLLICQSASDKFYHYYLKVYSFQIC